MTHSKFFTILCLFLMGAFASFSQPGGGGPPSGGGGPCANPPCSPVPITGIEGLIIVGGYLGIRAVMKGRKQSVK